MRYLLLIIASFIVLLSCTSRKNPTPLPQHQEAVPEALQEGKKKDDGGYKKPVPTDLLEQLYAELEEKDTVLQQLSSSRGELFEMRTDSARQFRSFEEKNYDYYSAAERHSGHISDSLLKLRILDLINNSQTRYNARTQPGRNLNTLIEGKSATLEDLLKALKIVKTLPMIEKYQQSKQPSLAPMNAVLREYNRAIQRTDSVLGK